MGVHERLPANEMTDLRLVQLGSYALYIYFSETESLNIGEKK